jgi:hypothetical protein
MSFFLPLLGVEEFDMLATVSGAKATKHPIYLSLSLAARRASPLSQS